MDLTILYFVGIDNEDCEGYGQSCEGTKSNMRFMPLVRDRKAAIQILTF